MSDDPVPYPQRNPHPYSLDVTAIPATVGPGEVVMWPHPIAGFEPVDDAPLPSPEPAPSKRKAASSAASGEETPQ